MARSNDFETSSDFFIFILYDLPIEEYFLSEYVLLWNRFEITTNSSIISNGTNDDASWFISNWKFYLLYIIRSQWIHHKHVFNECRTMCLFFICNGNCWVFLFRLNRYPVMRCVVSSFEDNVNMVGTGGSAKTHRNSRFDHNFNAQYNSKCWVLSARRRKRPKLLDRIVGVCVRVSVNFNTMFIMPCTFRQIMLSPST